MHTCNNNKVAKVLFFCIRWLSSNVFLVRMTRIQRPLREVGEPLFLLPDPNYKTPHYPVRTGFPRYPIFSNLKPLNSSIVFCFWLCILVVLWVDIMFYCLNIQKSEYGILSLLDDSNKMVFFNGLTVTYFLNLPNLVENQIQDGSGLSSFFWPCFFILICSSWTKKQGQISSKVYKLINSLAGEESDVL